MRKLTIVPLIAIAALLAIPALASSASAATITLGDSFFSPDSKTVTVGTKVKFNWTGKKKHNVTKKSGPGASFNSVTTKTDGINFVKTFNKAGVYKIFCTVHPKEMHMTLKVKR
jgi:plastocyanin